MKTNNSAKTETRKVLFLPNFYYCNALNNTNLGVFVGILTGFIANLFMKGDYSYKDIVFIICCLISVFFILLTIKQNQLFNDKCQNIKVNDTTNKFETTSEIINEFKQQSTYKKFKNQFISYFAIAVLSFVVGVFIYANNNKRLYVPQITCDCKQNDSIQKTYCKKNISNFDTIKPKKQEYFKTDSIPISKKIKKNDKNKHENK